MDPVSFRVHFVPVGFEVVRVTRPLEIMHAERVVLLTTRVEDRAAKYLSKIKEILRSERRRYEVVECNLWDTNEIVGRVGAIVRASPHHHYFFNASTGPKTACIAGTVAGMLWDVTPYYAAVDYGIKGEIFPEDHPVAGPIQYVPTFDVEELDASGVQLLTFLAERGVVEKFELIEHLKAAGIVRPKKPRGRRKTVTPQAFHAQTDVLLKRLERWGYVHIKRVSNRTEIHVTDQGRHGARLFGHVAGTPETLALLRS